jgi:uncharacterized protein YecE (DUF72 family)
VTDQLFLFGEPEGGREAENRAIDEALARHRADGARLAAALPEGVRFGTSSWAFPGWRGILYPSSVAASALAREGLRHYAAHPLMRTVGIDRSYYAPLTVEDLRRYDEQLPDGFLCCPKAPASVTSRVTPNYGGVRTQITANPDFLSVARLEDELLGPLDVAFRSHTGPIILEFPPSPRREPVTAEDFAERLDRFLEALPRSFDYAVEIRDKVLLAPVYREVLARHGAGHTYTYWSAMPMPLAQAAIVPTERSFVVIRLLLKPGTWYEDQRDRFTPFDRIVAVDEGMRDEVVQLTRRALARGHRVYVLVNNKAEGSSPLTIEALAQRLAAALADQPAG